MAEKPPIVLEAITLITHTNAAGVFGVTSTGRPFYSYARIPASEGAFVGVKLAGKIPYLDRAALAREGMEMVRVRAPRVEHEPLVIQRLPVPRPPREVIEMQRAPAPRPSRSDFEVQRLPVPHPVRGELVVQRLRAPRAVRAPTVSSPWGRLVLDASGRLVAPNVPVSAPVCRVVPVPVDVRGRAL